jgi:hypothetical protein
MIQSFNVSKVSMSSMTSMSLMSQCHKVAKFQCSQKFQCLQCSQKFQCLQCLQSLNVTMSQSFDVSKVSVFNDFNFSMSQCHKVSMF